MMIKLFFLAAASAMFMVYNVFQTQVTYRKPSSTPITSVPNVYSYQDILMTFDEAMRNETEMAVRAQELAFALESEKARYQSALTDRKQIMTMGSPYNPIRQNITQLETQLRRLQLMRHSNLDTAFMRMYFTYMQIQMPVQGSNKNLTAEQHQDARAKLEYLCKAKEQLKNPEYVMGMSACGYYSQEQAYMTNNFYAPQLPNPITALDTKRVDVAPIPTPEIAPPVVLPEGTVEPQPETAIAQ